MYKKRHIEERLKRLAQNFKVVLVNGARQVGKSTLIDKVFPGIKHITFNPVTDEFGAHGDPGFFLDNNPAPVILDEVQYVPDLLALLKMRVDQSDAKGQYILTGSQNFSVLKNISESLAGRVGIINLGLMTVFEQNDAPDKSWIVAYINDHENFYKHSKKKVAGNGSVFELIWRGSFPGVLTLNNDAIYDYYSSYIQTYVERDIRLMEDIKDQVEFSRFLGICSALTAQEINYLQLGREIGLTHTTARRWLYLLVNSFQWFELAPFGGNTIKRLTKKGKGYIADTGIACFLQRISTPLSLQNHTSFGSLFETYVIANIRNVLNSYLNVGLYHWRTSMGAEVDLIVEKDGVLYPIEVKAKTQISRNDSKGIRAFIETYKGAHKIGNAVIVYLGREIIKVDDGIFAVPFNMEITPDL